MNEPNSPAAGLPRRELLLGAGATGLGALLARPTLAGPAPGPALGPLAPTHPARRVLRGGACPMLVEQIEGPFYLDLGLVRQDITEGQPGLPTTLIFLVVDRDTCQPIPGAIVDVWHNNALGQYSGFPVKGTTGETWLRGIQIADASGLVFFQSIFPGWYAGRTTHIHLKVRPTPGVVATTQMYFDDFLPNFLYPLFQPYAQKGLKDTSNAQDAFYSPQMKGSFAANPDGSVSLWAGMILGV